MGLLALYGLLHQMLPVTGAVEVAMARHEAVVATDPSFLAHLGQLLQAGLAIGRGLFLGANFADPGLYLFVAIGVCVALHMGPSTADLWGAAPGLVALLIAVPGYEVLATTLAPGLPSLLPVLDRMIVWLVALLPLAVVLAALGAAPALVLAGWARLR